MNLTTLGTHLGLSVNKLGAVIKELKLQEDPNAFKTIKLGSQTYKRYSTLALETLKKEIPKLNMDELWEKHRPKSRGRKKRASSLIARN